jgi:hypothetical protein
MLRSSSTTSSFSITPSFTPLTQTFAITDGGAESACRGILGTRGLKRDAAAGRQPDCNATTFAGLALYNYLAGGDL